MEVVAIILWFIVAPILCIGFEFHGRWWTMHDIEESKRIGKDRHEPI